MVIQMVYYSFVSLVIERFLSDLENKVIYLNLEFWPTLGNSFPSVKSPRKHVQGGTSQAQRSNQYKRHMPRKSTLLQKCGNFELLPFPSSRSSTKYTNRSGSTPSLQNCKNRVDFFSNEKSAGETKWQKKCVP